jgi:hypothetical protein
VSDVIEFAVPWIVVPLYWAVWLAAFRSSARPHFVRHLLPMVLGTVLFTHGHGIHLSANSLSNLFSKLHKDKGAHQTSFVAALDLYDEFLSHILWVIGLCLLEWCIVGVQVALDLVAFSTVLFIICLSGICPQQTSTLASVQHPTSGPPCRCCRLLPVYC